MIFAAGPLTAVPPINGDTAITGTAARTSRSRMPGTARMGAMLNQGRVEVPTAVAAHPDRIMPPPPRSALEEMLNIVRFSQPSRGGHFAAMEQPADFVEDVRAFGRVVWPAG